MHSRERLRTASIERAELNIFQIRSGKEMKKEKFSNQVPEMVSSINVVPEQVSDHDIIYALCKYLKVDIRLVVFDCKFTAPSYKVEICPRQEAETLLGGVIKESDIPTISAILKTGRVSIEEASKKLKHSCLSCRSFWSDHGRAFCNCEGANRCFPYPMQLFPATIDEYSFYCSFYELNLDGEEHVTPAEVGKGR